MPGCLVAPGRSWSLLIEPQTMTTRTHDQVHDQVQDQDQDQDTNGHSTNGHTTTGKERDTSDTGKPVYICLITDNEKKVKKKSKKIWKYEKAAVSL